MIRTQISLDAKMYRAAQTEARRKGISLAEFVRRALAKAMEMEGGTPERKDPPWMRFSGAIRGGSPHDADNEFVDRVVYGNRN